MSTALRDIITDLGQRRSRLLKEVDEVTDHLSAYVHEGAAAGISEVDLALMAGVTRMTIRAWLGKGPK